MLSKYQKMPHGAGKITAFLPPTTDLLSQICTGLLEEPLEK
jgi:hypothetical protein